MRRLTRLEGAMYSVYRSKHALSAGKNSEFGGGCGGAAGRPKNGQLPGSEFPPVAVDKPRDPAYSVSAPASARFALLRALDA